MKISMTKKKWIALAAAVVALILLLVFVPFPLRINRTYYGYVHTCTPLYTKDSGKNVTIKMTGWRLCSLFYPEKWSNLTLTVTDKDGSPIGFSVFTCRPAHPEARAKILTEDQQPIEPENELYWSRVGIDDFYGPGEGAGCTLLYPPGYREIAVYCVGYPVLAITGSTDPDRSPEEVLEQFRVKLEQAQVIPSSEAAEE